MSAPLRQRLANAIDPIHEFRMAEAATRVIRAQALEEAARECEALGDKPGHDCIAHCAAAIRALKERR